MRLCVEEGHGCLDQQAVYHAATVRRRDLVQTGAGIEPEQHQTPKQHGNTGMRIKPLSSMRRTISPRRLRWFYLERAVETADRTAYRKRPPLSHGDASREG